MATKLRPRPLKPPSPKGHDWVLCDEVPHSYHYSGRSYSYQFKCPTCGKTCRQNTNFLGQRGLFCDGVNFRTGPSKLDIHLGNT